MRNLFSRTVCAVMMTALLLLALLPVSALAIDPIDLNKKNTLNIYCTVPKDTGVKLVGVKLRFYRVASASEFMDFTLMGDFVGQDIDLNNLDADGWRRAAKTLEATVKAEGFAPWFTYEVKDPDPRKAVSISSMPTGLYLLCFDPVVIDNVRYFMDPMMIALPLRDVDDEDGDGDRDEWMHTVTIEAKKWQKKQLTDITVVKVWSDKGWESTRPASVTIQLIGDGQIIDTIKLPVTKNGKKVWKYTWEDLEQEITDWTVREYPVPTNYKWSLDESGYTFTITNSRPPKPPTPDDELPQTGVDWWPVAVLAISGMVLFALGWLARRADEESDEA